MVNCTLFYEIIVLINIDIIFRDSPEWYQLHIGTERLRVPEIYFQPSIIGSDQAGISETLDFILKKYDAETSQALAKNVFVTGAPAQLPGLKGKLCILEKTLDQVTNSLVFRENSV